MQIKEAESGIAKALAALRQAENDYQRYSRLIEKDATSVQQYDAAVAQYEAAKASLDEMETRKAQLLVQSSRQYVTAPVDGKVLVLYRQQGAYVSAGTALALVGNFRYLYFSTPVEDQTVARMNINQKAVLTFDDSHFQKVFNTNYEAGNLGSAQTFTAQIMDITPPLSEPAAIRSVRWQIDNSSGLLEPQNYGGVTFRLSEGHRYVNGLIQSGFTNYTGKVDSAKINEVIAADAVSTLKDSEVVGNEKYLVTSNTDKVWNRSTKMYDGVVDIYYNPTTKNLLVDDINVNGGYVKLKGTVVSTGNGRIVSAKGGADISIDTTAVNNDIYLGTINNNNRQGVVVIDDPSKGLQTFTSNSTYTPDNYTFGWTGGINYRTTTKYRYSESGNIFSIFGNAILGLVTSGFSGSEAERYVRNRLDRNIRSDNVSKTLVGNPVQLKDLTQGAFLQKINNGTTWNNIKNNNLYTSTSSSDSTNTRTYNSKDDWSFHWGSHWYNRITAASIEIWRDWFQDEDHSAVSTYYIPANKQISIEMPTAANGSKISVNAKGNVYFDKNINNPTGGSSLSITSKDGAIETRNNSVIQGGNITFDAEKDIKADIKGINSNVNLNVLSSKGNITINTPDNLTADSIRTYDGRNVTINAGGDIKSTGNITAFAVNLNSERGNISAYLNPRYTVENVILNATAQGDINLTQRNGDLVIEKVESKNKDVTLTAEKGNILDGTGQTYELSDSVDRLQHWIDAGLISSEDSADSAKKAAEAQKAVVIEGLEQRAKTLAARYLNSEDRLKLYYDLSKKFAASNEMKNARTFYAYDVKNDSTINQRDSHNVNAAKESYQKSLTDTSTYNNDTDKHRAAYLERIKKFFEGTNLTPEEMSLVSDYAWANSSDSYGFSNNQLLYAIQDGILNSTPRQTVSVTNPNIVGNNITLKATNGGIGNDDSTAKTIKASDLNKLENFVDT